VFQGAAMVIMVETEWRTMMLMLEGDDDDDDVIHSFPGVHQFVVRLSWYY